MSRILRPAWVRLVVTLIVPLTVQGLAHLILGLLGLAGEEYSNIPLNIAALVACVALLKALDLTAEDIGLKRIKGRFRWHVVSCASLFELLVGLAIVGLRAKELNAVHRPHPASGYEAKDDASPILHSG